MAESDFASGDWFNATNGTNSTGGGSGFQPSTPLCIGLSAFGGFLEVSSTMVLAFPEFKTKMGAWQPSKCRDRIMMVLNLVLMGVASVAYIVGSWFGPVSLSVPVVMVSKLLFNMVLMGLVLRMTSFSKDQQVGTYCIACAILTLPEVGPMDQPGADVLALIVQPVALAWISVLTLATIVCVVGMVVLARRAKRAAKLAATAKKMARQSNSPGRPSDAEPDGSAAGECVSLIVYTMAQARAQFGALRRDSAHARAILPRNSLMSIFVCTTAQVVSAVLGTSISKMFARVQHMPGVLLTMIGLSGLFAGVNVVSLILAATAVNIARLLEQRERRPLRSLSPTYASPPRSSLCRSTRRCSCRRR